MPVKSLNERNGEQRPSSFLHGASLSQFLPNSTLEWVQSKWTDYVLSSGTIVVLSY